MSDIMHEGWLLETRGFDAATNRAWEGLFTQGSGYLHARGSVEEHFSDSPQNATWRRMPGYQAAMPQIRIVIWLDHETLYITPVTQCS